MKPHDSPHAQLADLVEAALRRSPTPPTWVADQRDAATRDAHRFFGAVAARMQTNQPDHGFGKLHGNDDIPAQAEFTAAILRCRWCCHLRGGWSLQPCFADLNRRVVRCMHCSKTYLKPIADDRCEICDSTGHDTFRPALIHWGPIVVAAEVASCCWHLLSGERKAA